MEPLAIGQMIREKSGTLRGQGELVGDVLIGVATGGTVKAISKSATVVKITSRLEQIAGVRGTAAEAVAETAAAETVAAEAEQPQR